MIQQGIGPMGDPDVVKMLITRLAQNSLEARFQPLR